MKRKNFSYQWRTKHKLAHKVVAYTFHIEPSELRPHRKGPQLREHLDAVNCVRHHLDPIGMNFDTSIFAAIFQVLNRLYEVSVFEKRWFQEKRSLPKWKLPRPVVKSQPETIQIFALNEFLLDYELLQMDEFWIRLEIWHDRIVQGLKLHSKALYWKKILKEKTI